MNGSHFCLNFLKLPLWIYYTILVSQHDIVGNVSFFQYCARFILAMINMYRSKLQYFSLSFSGIMPGRNICGFSSMDSFGSLISNSFEGFFCMNATCSNMFFLCKNGEYLSSDVGWGVNIRCSTLWVDFQTFCYQAR